MVSDPIKKTYNWSNHNNTLHNLGLYIMPFMGSSP